MDRNPAAGASRDWQDSGMGSLMLLDSASMYFRAFYGVKETMTAPDGTPVNAVRGFLDMVARLVRGRRPDQLIACLDLSWRPAFRVAAIPSYKAHRANPDGSEQIPDDLTVQIPILLDVLVATGVGLAGRGRLRGRRHHRHARRGGAAAGRGRHRGPRPLPGGGR